MADPAGLPRLTVLAGDLAGKELLLEEVVDNILIGSDASCRFHIPLPGVSPIHARLWMDAAGVTVYDTHSPRGLYVNDDRVSGQSPLKNGDILWLGTPGEEEAVMIQCRLPGRGAATVVPAPPVPLVAPPPPEPEMAPDVVAEPEDSETESTMIMEAPLAIAEPDALEVVEDNNPADATMVMAPEAYDVAPPPEEESEADATMVMAPEEPAASEPSETDATIVGSADAFYVHDDEPATIIGQAPVIDEVPPAPPEEEPLKFEVDAPPLPDMPPPVPPVFEDETQETIVPTSAPPPSVEPPPPPVVVAPPPRVAPPPPRETPVPVAAKPPRVAPPPVAPTPAPTPRPAARAGSSNAGRNLALGAVGLIVLGGASFAAWRAMQSKESTPTTAPSTTVAAALPPPPSTAMAAPPPPVTEPPVTTAPEPVVEEMVTIVKSPPPGATPAPGKPTPAPGKSTTPVAAPPSTLSAEAQRTQENATRVAALLGQAKAAAASRNFDAAAQSYEEVLKLEPQNPEAMEGRGVAQAAALSLKKSFIPGKTTIRSEKTAKSPAGFDTEDVSVAKAPDYSGRIEFEANPKNVKPGDSYTLLAYIVNDGKKSFKVSGASATTAVNGAKSGGSIQTNVKDLNPQQRVMLAEMPGVWQGGTTSWQLEVTVTTSRGDTLRNTVTWR